MKKRPVANFFWNNSKLSLYEYCCIKSFLKNDFDVNVFSYSKIKLPKKAKLKNANYIIKNKEIDKFIHNGKKGCIAAFSDKFRIELQRKNFGWWFDMDIICLKNSAEFENLEKNKDIIIGLETKNEVNTAVLKISNQFFLNKVSNAIIKSGYVLKWGQIGPKLLTVILKKEKKFKDALNQNFFYPVNYKNFQTLLLPNYYREAKKLCYKSYCCHTYNQILNRFGIPKNILPPKESFLYNQFIKYCPELKSHNYLPLNTAMRLLDKKNGFKENVLDLIPSFFRGLK